MFLCRAEVEITLSCASLLAAVACEIDASAFRIAGVGGWISQLLSRGEPAGSGESRGFNFYLVLRFEKESCQLESLQLMETSHIWRRTSSLVSICCLNRR
jgi:hypothetical protein